MKDDIGFNIDLFTGLETKVGAEFGIILSANMTQPHLNYGSIGLYGKYSYKPENLVYPSVSLTIGSGSAQGYNAIKSSTMDNFLNISGNRFFFITPSIGGGMNLTGFMRVNIGICYRFVSGFDDMTFTQSNWKTDEETAHTYKRRDINSLGATIQLQFNKARKPGDKEKSGV